MLNIKRIVDFFSYDGKYNTLKKRRVYFFIHPLAHLSDIANPSQVFWEANSLVHDIYSMKFVSFQDSIQCAQGLYLSNLEIIFDMNPGPEDLILIPGVDLNRFIKRTIRNAENESLSWLKQLYNSGVEFCSIGSGTILLAEAGILDGFDCTTHWKCYSHFKSKFPNINLLENKIYIKDRRITTSAGMSSSIDTVLSIVEDNHGPVFTSRLARELLIYVRRSGQDSQKSYYLDYKTHFNPLVHKAQNVISANLSKNYTNAELAEMLGTSERNLTRIFKDAIGISIVEFKNKLRIELYNHLIKNKSLSMAQIAQECGYSDTRQLRRLVEKYQES